MEIAWSLVLFTALTGCGGWLLAAVAIDEFAQKAPRADFPAAIAGLVLLAVGGLASVTHLAHPENMLAALNHPTSGIFVEAVLVGIAAAFAIVYLVVYGSSVAVRRVCAVAGALFGIALSFMAGHSYIMPAVETWNTLLLPLAYLGTAMAMGVALYCLIACVRGQGADAGAFFALLAIAGVVAAVACGLYFGHAAAAAELSPLYPGAAILLGGVVTAACGAAGAWRAGWRMGAAVVALVCAVVGAVCLRVAMWLAYVPLDNFFGLTF
ncbi:dimethyl sulfoxide reductase anchor subunit family protein [Parvibacter caecicola]|uniref:dimethyl sulfoxide reductase anchor subunit family protein n=1 Tax=Parvibacter caecicola TaxID=747645 RepID=UPI0023F032A9|nr:DmsC/YnfH family molybdoenzyme membrane anchor subunit [Parvibacter caecicola]